METQDRQPRIWQLEGTYSEEDIRAFTAFLAGRVAGSKIWALGIFILMPLLWAGDIRRTWPVMTPIGLVLVAFMLVLRFVVIPRKLYRAATRLPGVFTPRRITIDGQEVRNASDAAGHTFRLEEVQEVIQAPTHLFVMVAPKQGIPIPRAWIADGEPQLVERLLSRREP